ncbi:MAG: HPr(Ser) kinase/phosphatase [Acidiferrobacterales bacterium]
MNPTVTTNQLVNDQQGKLVLEWVAGRGGGLRELEAPNAEYPGMALVGHLNFVHPNRVQVIGRTEYQYLSKLSDEERGRTLSRLFGCKTTSLVVITGQPPDDDMIAAAENANMPLCISPVPSPVVIETLQYHLARALARRISVHGVFMEVMGIGVLITGDSGIGKSELALELLSRGHRLIADDAVELVHAGPDILVGQSLKHELLEYLEVRGLGILNVRTMFGETAVRHKKKVHFTVRLERLDKSRLNKMDRLLNDGNVRNFLEVDIPEVLLLVAPGRNLAVLVEAATRTHILRMWGINPVEEFIKKHDSLLSNSKQ